jgi:hypothetical protein
MGEREGLTKCHLRSRCRTLLPHSHALANAYLGFFPCFFLTCFFFSLLPNLLKVMQRARPSFNPKGTCPRWAESPAAPGGHKRRTRQFHSTREGRKMFGKVSVALDCRTSPDSSIAQGNGRERGVDKVSFALTLSHFVATLARTCKCLFGIFLVFSLLVYSFPRFPTYSRSCNGHVPLLIQKGRARARQKFLPRRVGQSAAPDSSTALGKGEKWCLSHSFFANVLHKVYTYIGVVLG